MTRLRFTLIFDDIACHADYRHATTPDAAFAVCYFADADAITMFFAIFLIRCLPLMLAIATLPPCCFRYACRFAQRAMQPRGKMAMQRAMLAASRVRIR